MASELKKLNLQRRRKEIELKASVERLCNVGASLTSGLNKREPKFQPKLFLAALAKANREMDEVKDLTDQIQDLMDGRQKEEKRQKLESDNEDRNKKWQSKEK